MLHDLIRIPVLLLFCTSLHAGLQTLSIKKEKKTILLRNQFISMRLRKARPHIIDLLHNNKPLLSEGQKSHYSISAGYVEQEQKGLNTDN